MRSKTSHCRRQSVIDFEETDEDGEHEALEAGADSLMFSLNDNDITVERLQQLSPSKKSGADYVVAVCQKPKSVCLAACLTLRAYYDFGRWSDQSKLESRLLLRTT